MTADTSKPGASTTEEQTGRALRTFVAFAYSSIMLRIFLSLYHGLSAFDYKGFWAHLVTHDPLRIHPLVVLAPERSVGSESYWLGAVLLASLALYFVMSQVFHRDETYRIRHFVIDIIIAFVAFGAGESASQGAALGPLDGPWSWPWLLVLHGLVFIRVCAIPIRSPATLQPYSQEWQRVRLQWAVLAHYLTAFVLIALGWFLAYPKFNVNQTVAQSLWIVLGGVFCGLGLLFVGVTKKVYTAMLWTSVLVCSALLAALLYEKIFHDYEIIRLVIEHRHVSAFAPAVLWLILLGMAAIFAWEHYIDKRVKGVT